MRSWAAWLVVVGCSNDGALIAGRYETSSSCGPSTFDVTRGTGAGESDELLWEGIDVKPMGGAYTGRQERSTCGAHSATSLTAITLTPTSSSSLHLQLGIANVDSCDPDVISAATQTCATDATLVLAGPVIDSFEPDGDCVGGKIFGSNFHPPVLSVTFSCCDVFTSMAMQSDTEIDITYVHHDDCHAATGIYLTNGGGVSTSYSYQ